MKEIKRVTIAEIEAASNFPVLLEEYAQESSISGLPHPKAKMATYKILEANGSLVAFGGYIDDKLVGLVTVLTYEAQKYSIPLSVCEAVFVSPAYRSTGLGIQLIRTAERQGRAKNAAGLLVSAPWDGPLTELLPKMEYVGTNKVFFKSFNKQEIVAANPKVEPMDELAIERVRQLEKEVFQLPQVQLETTHVLHAGIYARTIKIPAGMLITGALIKIETVLIVQGNCVMIMNEGARELHGYNILEAAANRKQAFLAKSDTFVTMSFATKASTVEEAENEFTDEADSLQTRRDWDTPIKGDAVCLAQ